MALDAWLPVNYALPQDTKLKAVIHEGVDWQIYSTHVGGRALLAKEDLANRWIKSGLLDDGAAEPIRFGKDNFYCVTSGTKHTLALVSDANKPYNKSDALAFAESMRHTRERDKESPLNEAIYVEKITRLLPTYSDSAPTGDDVVLGTWLTGGVPISANATTRLSKLIGWLDADDLNEIRARAGLSKLKGQKAASKKDGSKAAFSLAGRPYLENFFNEHVIDIIQNQDRYAALGIDFPAAMILHGPPGCGKTYAIERLVEFLEWPCYHIEASSVASPFIHETSKKVAAVFEQAMENAPSVIVIDEMEAFLTTRDPTPGHHHRTEEVAEFLRRIPEAVQNKVLIVAMTNRLEMIDPAIRRRGRFDHIIEVGMASEAEVMSLLEKLIEELPQAPGIDIPPLAQALTGRPLSDVAFMVREGARLAARAGKDKIDQECLLKALASAPARHDQHS